MEGDKGDIFCGVHFLYEVLSPHRILSRLAALFSQFRNMASKGKCGTSTGSKKKQHLDLMNDEQEEKFEKCCNTQCALDASTQKHSRKVTGKTSHAWCSGPGDEGFGSSNVCKTCALTEDGARLTQVIIKDSDDDDSDGPDDSAEEAVGENSDENERDEMKQVVSDKNGTVTTPQEGGTVPGEEVDDEVIVDEHGTVIPPVIDYAVDEVTEMNKIATSTG